MATLTSNKNFLSPVGFTLKINSTRYANLEYFCSTVSIPTLNMAGADVPYQGINFTTTGERITFGELSITANVTEDFDNYIETFNWMHTLANSRGKAAEDAKEDATLMVYTSHNNISKQIRFKGIFPTSISELAFDTKTESLEYVQMTVGFSYTNFEFIE